MLQMSPQFEQRLSSSTFESIELSAIKREHKRIRRRRRIAATLSISSFLGLHAHAIYAEDVKANRQLQASASIEADHYSDALDPLHDDNAWVFINGFGSNNANVLAKYPGQAVQPILDGQMISVDYDNAPLDPAVIADRIIAQADERGITSLSLYGHSAGGNVVMDVNEQLCEKRPDLPVASIALNSTPASAAELRAARQSEADLIDGLTTFVPDAIYSNYVRFIGEMFVRADRYSDGDIGHFFETADEVQRLITNEDLPGSWLMVDQMLVIETSDMRRRIENIATNSPACMRPTIIYLGTGPGGYDSMVDDKTSATKICGYADVNGIPCFTYQVPNAVHSRPDLANEELIETLAAAQPAIRNSIEQQQNYYDLMGGTATAQTALDGTPAPSPPPTDQ